MVTNGYQRFCDDFIAVSHKYSKLALCSDTQSPYIKGPIDIMDADGAYIDSFEILIRPKEEYPSLFPMVFNTDGKIPVNIDWHVYENYGHFCIATQLAEIIRCAEGINLLSFIEKDLKAYLFNQIHRRVFGYFSHERAHGFKGDWQEYEEVFKTKDPLKMTAYLDFIRQRREPKRTHNCFCGKKKLYRQCHREAFRKLAKLPDRTLQILKHIIVESEQFKMANTQAIQKAVTVPISLNIKIKKGVNHA